jgi:hypothetical protein
LISPLDGFIPEKSLWYPWNRRLGGPDCWCECLKQGKNLLDIEQQGTKGEWKKL